jgi:hypothetical protein
VRSVIRACAGIITGTAERPLAARERFDRRATRSSACA